MLQEAGEHLTNAGGVFAGHGVFEDNGELVAAGAGHGVGAANAAEEELANALEQKVADVMADGVVDLLELVKVDEQESGAGSAAASALKGAGETILKEAAVGEAGEIVVQSEVFVVLDLVFKQEQDHADGDDVFGQVPNFTLDVERGEIRSQEGGDDEDGGPCEESGEGDESSGSGAAVSNPEMDATAHVDGEDDGVEGQVLTVGHTHLEQEQKDGEPTVEDDRGPAQSVAESAAQGEQGDGERTETVEQCGYDKRAAGLGHGVNQGDVERVGDQQNGQHPAAGRPITVRNAGPHEEHARPGEGVPANEGRDGSEEARNGGKNEGRKVKADHDPGDEPEAGDGGLAAPRH